MSHRAPSPRFWILAAAWLAATGGAASVGRTQQVTGSIGASLTILGPVAASPPRIAEFDVGRDGIARIETADPASARTSAFVMMRVATSAADSAAAPQPPRRVTAASVGTRGRYLLRVERDERSDRFRPRTLRVVCLIVAAGT